jgi:hypothetical protein
VTFREHAFRNCLENRKGGDWTLLLAEARRLNRRLCRSCRLMEVPVFIGDMYSGSAFELEYQEKKNRDLRNSSIVQFIQRLRNYALHRSIPVTTTKLKINRVGFGGSQVSVTGSITLKVDELRKWDGWNAKSREYLNTLGNDVAITQVANEYRDVIDSFYTWLNERQQELHSETIKETIALEERLTQVQQEWERAWGMSD